MDSGTEQNLKQVWRQRSTPVIYRQGKGLPLLVRLPYSEDNREWLKAANRNKPSWDSQHKCWETPKAWFNDLIKRILVRYDKLYIIQPYQEQEKCAPACWNAVGHECQCSCMGANHGSHNSTNDWFVVSDSFATRWGDRELACRLMRKNDVL